ncbi:cutinase transcription factor 1 alpha [Coccidioides immitis H538.4]|uniref:Cutinase transcription factor 1 alpha n=3 Tax=Coccidioides immitis TaxID=5501 RepID=A0A0J8QRR3_COCIT|nr:cutinase transcription factor 1 alpha [Coccidioides immitis RMSCC 2394]KMU75186.1 cutinase transcription factor 1 alpha [Coccidioides immitis RMSCC 3703]KMU92001.1 cutinase transcription factor 1 alpha [Coccidioides immitis H538.4]
MSQLIAGTEPESDREMTDREPSAPITAPTSTVTPAADADPGVQADVEGEKPSANPPKPGAGATPTTSSGHPSFRRQRASRACETCHARKVRCDAASLGVPCTNCVAFSIECKIPTPKRKKNQKAKDAANDESGSTGAKPTQREGSGGPRSRPVDGMPVTSLTEAEAAQQAQQNHSYAQFMKPKFARAPITEAGRVAYLGESSNLSILVHDRHGTTDVVHYPLPESIRGPRARLTELDSLEIDILHQRGAFLLPPRSLCDELVDAYFKWVAPAVPIINRSRFMKRYRDPKNPPSILLLQAVLLAGSRVCTNPQLMDANGSTTPAATTFYKRAKSLFDANYEDDRVTIVQALVLMGWYWEGPEDVTKNVFYWTRVAIIVAQGSGMHRSVEASQLSRADKRLWKRIWWTLFTRDRSVAVALGRPVNINIDDSDVEMLTEDDFIEDEADSPAESPPDPTHVQFFLQYVKLCEIMGLVLSQQYSVASKYRRTNAMDLTHSDMALADWLQNCPREVYWDRNRHHFWSALLHSHYYTTLCLLHRAHMPPATGAHTTSADGLAYPSRTIAFQAAAMITSIVENLQAHDQLKYTPAFIVYSLFSALIMHVYQMRSAVPSVVSTTQDRIGVCMQALKDVSKVWLVAKMVCTLFESILGNKALEERLQRAAGKRHQKQKSKKDVVHPPKKPEPPKRKFDDLDISIPNGPPSHQVSYERSRPQTPAATPSMQPAQIATTGATQMSPQPHHRGSKDGLLGPSGHGVNTRPTSPFNPSFSMPTTPPDFFLVTRNSPNLSQSLWENFQPDQLFPDGTNITGTGFSPSSGNAVDPQLHMSQHLQPTGMGSQAMGMHQQQQHLPSRGPRAPHESPTMMQGMPGMGAMGHQQHLQPGMAMQTQPWVFDGNMHIDASSQDDNWSNSSRGQGPVVPPTLNVEDWFQFFGINGIDSLGIDQM